MRLTGERHLGLATRPRKRGQSVEARVELGVNLIDTADAYGRKLTSCSSPKRSILIRRGSSSRPKRQHPARTRSVGAERSPDYLKQAVDKSLKRLQLRTDRFVSVATASIQKCRWKNRSARSRKCRSAGKSGMLDYRKCRRRNWSGA